MTSVSPSQEIARAAHAWPFEEARKVLARVEKRGSAGKPKDYVLFETGYGPSGLPHIGTFGEVARTTWVRRAFEAMSDVKTRLISFSDDMDGLRKVPGNVPNQDMLRAHLGQPLTAVPDPFGTHESYGAHNNARLRAFLDRFGFDYEFLSSTECYKSGRFDAALLNVLAELRESARHRAADAWARSAARPIRRSCRCRRARAPCCRCPILEWHKERGTIVYDEDGKKTEVPVTGGHCKLQWKADWAMRWLALGVDYEMSGKDLISSVELSSKIQSALGGLPPDGFNYELFLDENGERISKSRGNGLTVDEWLDYGPEESIALFMFQKPRVGEAALFRRDPQGGRRLHRSPEAVPLERNGRSAAPRNPVWHIHHGHPPHESYPVSFALLLNLVSASNANDRDVLWGFIRAYAPDAMPANPGLDRLVGYALQILRGFREAAEALSRAERKGARGAARRSRGHARQNAGERDSEKVQNRGLRNRQAPRLRAAARLVQGALRSSVRPDAGPALRLLRGACSAAPRPRH
jgi:lysyl-tRNA synthetase class 1